MSVLPAPPTYAGTRQTPPEARGQGLQSCEKCNENGGECCYTQQVEVNVKGLLIELLPGAAG
jgi:hypothetical protein